MKNKLLITIFILISILLIGCNKNKNEEVVTDTTTEGATLIPTISVSQTAAPTVIPAVLPTDKPIPTTIPTPTVTPIPTPSPAPVDLANSMTKDNFPVIDGSTATIPLSEAVYQLATGATEEEAASVIVHTKTSQAYYKLVYDEADILIVYEPSDEVKEFMKKNGYNLQMKPIGKDALVFMTNASNPVESLSKDQLVEIYSGKITNWFRAGGENKELLAFQRPVNTGSQTLMLKHVMGDVPMMAGPEVQVFSEMGEILNAMANYTNEANTLGYSVFYYAKNMYNLPELRFMKVNGIEPSSQTIYDNSYPFINEFYAVIREDEPYDSNAHKIFDWLTQDEGQELVRSTGYVPVSLPPSDKEDEENVIADQIPEGYVYIMKSEMVNEVGTDLSKVTIYEDHWKVKRIFINVSSIDEVGLVSNDTYLRIKMAVHESKNDYAFKFGLCYAGTGKFKLQPQYESMYAIDDNENYYYAETDDKYMVVDRNGNVMISNEITYEETYERTNGDYYWFYNNDYSSASFIQIYDKKFKLVRKIPISDTNNQINADDGTVLFSKSMFLEQFQYQKDNSDDFFIASYSDLLIIVYFDENYWVIDYQMNLIAKHALVGERYDSYYQVFNNIYREITYINQQKESKYYDFEGNEITGSDDSPYYEEVWSYYKSTDNTDFQKSYLYHTEADEFDLFDYDTGEHIYITMQNAKDYYLDFVYGNFIIIRPFNNINQRTKVYYKGNILMDLNDRYYADYNQSEDSILLFKDAILTDYRPCYYMKIGKDGKVEYQSTYPEELISIDERYIQVNRGNYTGVIDDTGKFIMKSISEQLSND